MAYSLQSEVEKNVVSGLSLVKLLSMGNFCLKGKNHIYLLFTIGVEWFFVQYSSVNSIFNAHSSCDGGIAKYTSLLFRFGWCLWFSQRAERRFSKHFLWKSCRNCRIYIFTSLKNCSQYITAYWYSLVKITESYCFVN